MIHPASRSCSNYICETQRSNKIIGNDANYFLKLGAEVSSWDLQQFENPNTVLNVGQMIRRRKNKCDWFAKMTRMARSCTIQKRIFFPSLWPRKRCNKDFAWSLGQPWRLATKWITDSFEFNTGNPLKMTYIFETMPMFHVSQSWISKFSTLSPPGNANEISCGFLHYSKRCSFFEHGCCDVFSPWAVIFYPANNVRDTNCLSGMTLPATHSANHVHVHMNAQHHVADGLDRMICTENTVINFQIKCFVNIIRICPHRNNWPGHTEGTANMIFQNVKELRLDEKPMNYSTNVMRKSRFEVAPHLAAIWTSTCICSCGGATLAFLHLNSFARNLL